MKKRLRRRGIVFYQYLFSYIAILLISLVLSITIYNTSGRLVNKESHRANELLLSQMTNTIDVILSDAEQLANIVSYSPRLQVLLYQSLPLDNRDQYRLYQLFKEFGLYQLSNSKIIDFYVYIPSIDRIVTPSGIHSVRQYLEYWLPEAELSVDEWKSQFTDTRQKNYSEFFTTPVDMPIMETISIISPINTIIFSDKPPAWLGIHIDKRYFHDVFKNTMWTEQAWLVVYHEDSGIITSSGLPEDLSLFNLTEQGNIITADTEVFFGGMDYIVMTMDSKTDAKLHYVSLIPEDIYKDQFRNLRRFFSIQFLFAFILGVFLIYRFSTARYKPVQKLLEILNPPDGHEIALLSDEFALISSTMQMTIKEDKQLRNDIKQSEIIIAQRFMRQLLKGMLKYDDEAKRILSGYGVKFLKSHNTLILMDIELDEEADLELRDRFIQELSLADQGQSLFIIRDLDGAVVFLINHDEEEFEELIKIIKKRKIQAEMQLPLFLAIGISNMHPKDTCLSRLYNEAHSALEFRLVRGRKNPIRFTEVKTSSSSYYYPIQVELKMINSIKIGDHNAASLLLEEIYTNNFSKNLPNLEIAQCLIFDLISTMIKTLNEIPTIEEDSAFWEGVKPITTLMNCRSFDQLRTEMGEILERVCHYVIAGKINKNDILKKEIIQFVEKHYHNKNLSPDLIASYLNRNKAYLCRIFRDIKGIGISAYIKYYRVKIAKEHMSNKNLSINAIADEVGFSGSNAFIRAFKEIEGITPGQYLSSPSL